mmetsp:Transcript_4812/g.6747  ORF Transcript_4812/g.6747 Transcript_4812/m.6747 type:complete len:186 (-) Transcript_4812:485-1042(-)
MAPPRRLRCTSARASSQPHRRSLRALEHRQQLPARPPPAFFSSSSASSASTARRRRAANSSVTAAKRAASVTAAARYAAAVLQVAPTASPEELRAAFRKRALESHPDKANGSTDEFRAVKAAFDTLQGPGGSADRERTPRKRAPRQARKPTATAATPRRALSPRALARSQGIFPQCSASSIGLLF